MPPSSRRADCHQPLGAQPTADERDHYVGLLESGAHTRGSLALFAAETDALAQMIGLAAWGGRGAALRTHGLTAVSLSSI